MELKKLPYVRTQIDVISIKPNLFSYPMKRFIKYNFVFPRGN